MFKYPEDITFTTMARKSRIEDTWFSGNFAAAPRIPNPMYPEYSGAQLVIQYIEGYIYRTYGLYRANNNYIAALYNKAREIEDNDEQYPTLESLMKAC
jgi:hypothetical protein